MTSSPFERSVTSLAIATNATAEDSGGGVTCAKISFFGVACAKAGALASEISPAAPAACRTRRRVAEAVIVTGDLPEFYTLGVRALYQWRYPRQRSQMVGRHANQRRSPPPSEFERRQFDPAALAVALVAGFGELDALGAFDQRRRKRRVFGDMAQEQFPAGAIAVLEWLDLGDFLPLFVEHHGLRLLGAEKRLRRRDRWLDKAAMQPSDRRAQGAVDLDLQEVVALHPVRPGRADLRQGAALQLEDREGMVLDIDLVAAAVLVAPCRQRGHVAARDRGDRAEQPVEDVAPMGEHIEDQPAAALLPVIPARALRRGELAVEHPPAEFEPDRQHPAEELRLIEPAQLFEAGQEQFVLDDAAFLAGMLGGARERQRILQI